MGIKQGVRVLSYRFSKCRMLAVPIEVQMQLPKSAYLSRQKKFSLLKTRFDEYGVHHSEITNYANRAALHFEDDEGLRMVLLVSNGEKVGHWETWENSDVPVEHQIQGMGSIEITVRKPDKLARTLTEVFGYTEVLRTTDEAIFQSVKGKYSEKFS